MPQTAPAIDFSATTRQITESANRAMQNLAKTVEFDLNMLEKRRVEFMNEAELSQLDQHILGIHQETAIETIDQFSDRWTKIYSDKNGRLSNQDLMNMRREKQVVEKIIQKNNATQTQIRNATKVLQSKEGSKYDSEYTNDAMRRYAAGEEISADKRGVSQDNPFLQIQPVDPVFALTQIKPIRELDRDEDFIESGDGWRKKTVIKYATDEEREAYILDRMRTDQQFSMGIVENYEELSPEQRETITQRASELNINPYDFYALTFKDYLWRDRGGIAVDMPTERKSMAPSKPDPLDIRNRPIEKLSFHEKTIEGYDLLDLPLKTSRNITNARNLDTGEIEDLGGVDIKLAGYDPQRNKIIVQARIDKYAPIEMRDEEPLYVAERTDAPGAPLRGTKEEVEEMIKNRKDAVYSTPKVKRQDPTRADIYYELDGDQYSNLLKGINLPQKKTQKRVKLY